MDFLDFGLSVENEDFQLEQLQVSQESHVVGKTLEKLAINRNFETNIISIKRGDQNIYNPPVYSVLQGGDILIALGSQRNLQLLRKFMHQ